jgi:methylenetetrahydrofolate reductase (NADPH)
MDAADLSPIARKAMTRLLEDPIYEMIPLSNALEQAVFLPTGARISVTASPNKTLEDSLDLAAALSERGFRVTPHLSARMTVDLAHLERLLGRMSEIGIDTAFVVGGDAEYTGAFYDGLSLLQGMERIGHELKVGVPAYPEGHPKISDEALASALADKQPYASWMTSQMCFDPQALLTWLAKTRGSGIDLPLVLGLPGAADRTRLLKIGTRIGVGRSMSFLRKNTGLISAFVKPGGYDPGELLFGMGDEMSDETAAMIGVHIYTFNQCDLTESWRQELLAAL